MKKDMLCRVYSAACVGIETIVITVEVDVSKGISFYMVGLPDSAVRESQQRISTAMHTVDAGIPGKRITVNLAPADIRKEGSSFDLAIALGILAASSRYVFPSLGEYLIMGELALDGTLRPVPGALPVALHAAREGFKGCILPKGCACEAADAGVIDVFAANNLREVVRFLSGERLIVPLSSGNIFENEFVDESIPNFKIVKGQEHVKRGLEIAAAGGHNLLMSGPPGSGKTLMAKALPGILPPMSKEEAIETSVIYSVYGNNNLQRGIITSRPFRAPHHSSSLVAIAGGGSKATPGEISLAHNGVLYLDEMPEFKRPVLEILRQPLEDKIISISRARYKVSYPCNFMLVASMNPCPCGYYGVLGKECRCMPYEISRYRSRISGPLLDRIDLNMEVNPIPGDRLMTEENNETSQEIRKRVVAARDVQSRRFMGRINTNSQMRGTDIAKYCSLGSVEKRLLSSAINRFDLSARGFTDILKVARTIADLDDSQKISASHLAEAIQYRLPV